MASAQGVSLTSPASRSVPFVELRQTLPSRIPIISPFVEQLMRFIARFRNSDASELNIETALREALAARLQERGPFVLERLWVLRMEPSR